MTNFMYSVTAMKFWIKLVAIYKKIAEKIYILAGVLNLMNLMVFKTVDTSVFKI